MGNLLSYMEETIGGLRIIKAFNAEKKIEEKFKQENQGFTKVMNNVARRDYLASPLSEFLGPVFTFKPIGFGINWEGPGWVLRVEN